MQSALFRQARSTNLLALFLVLAVPASAWASDGDALAALNQEFRSAYKNAREVALEGSTAILLVGDRMITIHRGVRKEVNYVPAIFAQLKSLAHLPLTIFVMLHDATESPLNTTTLRKLQTLDQRAATARSGLPTVFTGAQRKRQQQILQSSRGFIKAVMKSRAVSRSELETFARRMEPLVTLNVDEAARAQLNELNLRVAKFLTELSARERKNYYIVMVGGHQARVGNLQMQYFRALLKKPEEAKLRLLYAENARDEAGALRVLATHVLDMKASQAFFGIPTRLQRDILADATKTHIPQIQLP